jgi:O-antigen ligase/tetratricopeptide (TPR) repeat protein
MQSFLLQCIRVLALLSAFTPLVRSSQTIFGNVVDRTLYFWALTEIMTFAWVILCTLNTAYQLTFKRLLLGITAWITMIVISTIFAESGILSFLSTFERMMGLLTYLHLFVFFVVTSSVLSKNDWRNLLVCLCAAGLISTFLALVFRLERNLDGRITGTFGNPSFLAAYTVGQVVITCLVLRGMWVSSYKKWAILVAAIILPLHMFVIVLTGSRSALVSIILGILVTLLAMSIYIKPIRYWFAGFCLLVIGVFTGIRKIGSAVDWLPNQFAYLHRIFDLSFTTNTFTTRRNLWGVAWDAACAHPVLGWGFEGFPIAFLKFYNPVMYSDGLWYDNPHNILLEWMINGGILGLAGFLLCFIMSFVLLWQHKELSVWTKSLLSGYGTAYLCFNFSNFDSLSTVLLLFTFWAFIQFNDSRNVLLRKAVIISPNARLVIQSLAVMVTLLCLYAFVVKTYRINQDLGKASRGENLSVSAFAYKKLYETALVGKYDVLLQAGLRRNSISPTTEKGHVENYYLVTQAMLENGLQKFGNSGQLLNQLGHLNVFAGNYKNASHYFENFRQLAPNRQANLIDLGIVYLESGELQKAIGIFEHTYNLDRSFDFPLIYKAIAEAKLGRYLEARKTISLVSIKNIAENGELIYLAMDNTDNREFFCDLYSQMTEAQTQMINQKTYFTWMNVAFDLKNDQQLRSAFNSYRYNFNVPENEIMPILDLAIHQNVRPTEVARFFSRYPGR